MSEKNTPQPLQTNKSIEKPFQQFNGVHSSQSSRSSSPSVRLGQIPSSQLPPSNRPIPQSQLPPSRSPLTTITQQVSGLKVDENSPNVSPKFSTSTPNLQNPSGFTQPVGISPVTSASNKYSNSKQQQKQDILYTATSSGPSSQFNQQQSMTASSSAPSTNQSNLNMPASQPTNQMMPQISSATMMNSQNIHPNLNSNLSQASVIPHISALTNPSHPPNIKGSIFASTSQNLAPNIPQASSMAPPQSAPPATKPLSNAGFVPISAPNSQYNQQHSHKAPQQQQQSQAPLSQGQHNSYVQAPRPIMPNTNFRPSMVATPNQNANYPTPQQSVPLPSMPNNQNQQLVNNRNNMNSYYPLQNNMQMQRPTVPTTQIYNSVNSMIPPLPPAAGGAPPPAIQNYQPQQQLNVLNGPPSILQQTPPNQHKTNLHSNRYPVASTIASSQPAPTKYPTQQQNMYSQQAQTQQNNIPSYSQLNAYQTQPMVQQNSTYNNQQYKCVAQLGYNKMWGTDNFDLLQTSNILPHKKEDPPRINLGQELLDQANCSTDIFRCTLTKIPENNTLLQKARLPLGVLIHPFKDLSHLPVIQCNVIVRCRACRTYINPFVFFVDNKRWKCNLCYRVNELPEEFQYDPYTKTYGDPSRRPEIKSSTLEYVAPAEYMLRPPQPAVYLFLLDVSRFAVESGYLSIMTTILLEEIKNLPGDARTQIGFIAYDSALHFYSMPDGTTQPHEMTVLDIDDVFLPTPDNLLVNLKDKMELVMDLLTQLPNRYINTYDTNSALGAALQVAFKMMGATGGRVTVLQASLPNIGPGALTAREDPAQRSQAEAAHLNPANDFYKRLALECSGQQIAVDLFIVNSQYVDVATISGISRFSGGCIHHFPLLRPNNIGMIEGFSRCFRRYLTRKIGFEAVMRIRCTRGLSVHTFHGNFFVRSTDLLSLPNINPDAGFGMQVSIEESLSDVQSVCFQAALLYTSSKGERRIRVHTMCLPVVSTLHDVIHSADQECIVGLLSKMAVDRSTQSNLSDAREAFMNVAIDTLSSYKLSLNMGSPQSGLLAPKCLSLLPLYISALLKYTAFKVGGSTRLDDRVMAMIEMKTKPLYLLIQMVYPDLYPVHELEMQEVILNTEEEQVPIPPRLQLTARCLESKGAYLMDAGDKMYLLVCPNVSPVFLNEALGVQDYNAISNDMFEVPILDNERNRKLITFVNYLNDEKPYPAPLQVLKDNSPQRLEFFQRLIEDRMENALSYHEFLQHLKTQVK